MNLKRGPEALGHYSYDDILDRLKVEVDALIAARGTELTRGSSAGSTPPWITRAMSK